jgi:hypothetical protein
MSKLSNLPGVSGFVIITLVVAVVGVRTLTGSSEPVAQAEPGTRALTQISEEVLALSSLRAHPWVGPTDGLISEQEALEVASTFGDIVEVALVELSNTGRPGDPPPHGFRPLDSPIFDDARGPVWAAVMGDRPYDSAMLSRDNIDITDEGVEIVGWYNIWFFSAVTGEKIFGVQAEITEADLSGN